MLSLLTVLIGCSVPAEAPRREGLHPVTIDVLVAELGATRPRPRIYNFWATWCGPCLAELPALREFGRKNPTVDLVLVNVDLASLRDKRVQPTIERMELMPFENLLLDDPDPARALNAVEGWPNTLPVTYLVDPAGERRKAWHTRVDEATLAEAVEAL